MTYEHEKRILEYERKRELRIATLELEQLQKQKQRAEHAERQRFKDELRYRMKQNTTKYLTPKTKARATRKTPTPPQQPLDLIVFTQRQMELAQRIIDRMEGTTND